MAEHQVLIVEDDLIVAHSTRTTLSRMGYDTLGIVTSGEVAVERASVLRPDLILMDIELQGEMDGIEAARRIRAQHNIPVVYVTAYADEEILERVKGTAPMGYVLKPFGFKDLQSAITLAMDRHRMESKIRHLNRVLRAIRAVHRLITTEKDRNRLLKAACDVLVDNRGYHGAWIAIFAPDGTVAGVFHSGLVGDCLLNDAANWPPTFLPGEDPAVAPGTVAVLDQACPLSAACPELDGCRDLRQMGAQILHHTEVHGAMVVSLPADLADDAEEQALFREISEDLALALHTLREERVRRQAERRLQRRNRDLTVLNGVISAATTTFEPADILRELCAQLAQAFALPQVAATLIEAGQAVATVVAECRGADRPSALEYPVPLSQPAMASVLEAQQPLFIADAQTDVRLASARFEMRRRGTVSLLLVPIVVRDRVISTLELNATEPRTYGAEDLALIQGVAAAVGQALEAVHLHQALSLHAENLESMVDQRTEELRAALKLAQSADEAKSQFISNVSHELRTPLASIRLYLSLLNSADQVRRPRYLQSLSRETERLQTLIESILTISRLDLGAMAADLHPMNLNRLLSVLAADRRQLFARRDLALHVDLLPDLPEIVADTKLLEQVATNLLTNAMHYTPAGGEVYLSTSLARFAEGCWCTFSVRDTGPGIPEGEQGRLFERFYRGGAAHSSKAPGTGLGLAICKEIVALHQGYITLQSVVGEGSTFTVWLPTRPLDCRGVVATIYEALPQ